MATRTRSSTVAGSKPRRASASPPNYFPVPRSRVAISRWSSKRGDASRIAVVFQHRAAFRSRGS